LSIDIQGICPMLSVFDMRASLAFYRDVLGFGVVQASPPPERLADENFGWVWLRRDTAELMLNSLYDPDEPRRAVADPARTAAHEDAALFVGCPDVDAAYLHLQSHGVDVAPPKIAPYGMKQLWVKDPDGFVVCFQWRAAE
jgi:glyoxylase I family protein